MIVRSLGLYSHYAHRIIFVGTFLVFILAKILMGENTIFQEHMYSVNPITVSI